MTTSPVDRLLSTHPQALVGIIPIETVSTEKSPERWSLLMQTQSAIPRYQLAYCDPAGQATKPVDVQGADMADAIEAGAPYIEKLLASLGRQSEAIKARAGKLDTLPGIFAAIKTTNGGANLEMPRELLDDKAPDKDAAEDAFIGSGLFILKAYRERRARGPAEKWPPMPIDRKIIANAVRAGVHPLRAALEHAPGAIELLESVDDQLSALREGDDIAAGIAATQPTTGEDVPRKPRSGL